MLSKHCWRNDCCSTSIRTVWPGNHACAFLCTFCLPLSLAQVSAILWPGGWLNRFLCWGLGFFFSLSLFFILHTIFQPLFSHCHLEQVSLFLFLSHSLFLLLPPLSLCVSCSPSLYSSLFLSPPPSSLPGRKIFMLSHEVVWGTWGWRSRVDKVSSNLSQETGLESIEVSERRPKRVQPSCSRAKLPRQNETSAHIRNGLWVNGLPLSSHQDVMFHFL